jgi:hypothetical protein
MLVPIRTVSAGRQAVQIGDFILGIAYHEDCKAREWLWEEFRPRLGQKRSVCFPEAPSPPVCHTSIFDKR